MLSAYIDGQLGEPEREKVADHVSRCEDCYLVIREGIASLAALEGPASDAGPSPPAVETGPQGHRTAQRWSQRTWALPLAATLVVALGGYVVLRQAPWRSRAGARHELVEALGKRRAFEARLTGGFAYGPLIGVKRAAGLPDSDRWSLLAAAAKAKRSAEQNPSPGNVRAVAAAMFLLGEFDEGLGSLETLRRAGPADAALLSDLAAGYIARADSRGSSEDYSRAFELASRATEIEPSLREAAFNKALALEHLSLRHEARAAWLKALELEGEPDWRQFILDRLKTLEEMAAPRIGSSERLRRALARTDDRALEDAISESVGLARDFAELELLGAGTFQPEEFCRFGASFFRATADPYLSQTCALSGATGFPALATTFARARKAYDAGQWSIAQGSFEQLLQREGDEAHPLVLWTQLHLAILLFQRDTAASRQPLERLELNARSLDYFLLQGRVQWVLGLVYLDSGEFDRSLTAYQRALELFVNCGHTEWAGFMKSQLAEAQHYLGNERLRAEWRTAALRARFGFREPFRRRAVLLSAADAATDRGQPRLGLAFLDELEAEEADSPGLATTRNSYRHRARALNAIQPGSGELHLQDALAAAAAIADPDWRNREIGETRFELAASSEALDLQSIDSAIAWQTQRGNQNRLPVLYSRRAARLASDGRIEEALAAVEQGLDLFEKPRRYRDQILLTPTDNAWALYEQNVVLRVSRNEAPSTVLDAAERAWSFAFSNIGVRHELALDHRRLAHGEAIVAYFVGNSELFAWSVRRQGAQLHRLGKQPQLDAQIHALLQSMRSGDSLRFSGPSEQLHSALFEPLREALSGVSRLVIVPHRELARVPFGALRSAATRRFVVEDFVVSIAPSVRFATMQPPDSGRARVFAAGNPDTGGEWPALPAAEIEVRTIASLYKSAVTLTGRDDTATAFLREAAKADVIHLATHAEIHPRYPALSGLVFAASYRLRAHEIAGLRLPRSPLVILAACESAAQPESPTASVEDLLKSFLRAGARSAVGSLLSLEDRVGFSMFERMHRELANGLSVAESIAVVQRGAIASSRDQLAALAIVVYAALEQS